MGPGDKGHRGVGQRVDASLDHGPVSALVVGSGRRPRSEHATGGLPGTVVGMDTDTAREDRPEEAMDARSGRATGRLPGTVSVMDTTTRRPGRPGKHAHPVRDLPDRRLDRRPQADRRLRVSWDSLLTTAEVCAYIPVPRSTWDTWRKEGKTPPATVLPNRELRYWASDIDAWLLNLGEV